MIHYSKIGCNLRASDPLLCPNFPAQSGTITSAFQTSSDTPWIIDYGATDHMSGMSYLFSYLNPLSFFSHHDWLHVFYLYNLILFFKYWECNTQKHFLSIIFSFPFFLLSFFLYYFLHGIRARFLF